MENFGANFPALLLLLIVGVPANVSAGAQIDVGLGESRFFLGEQFSITFKDIVYWVAGLCMGFIFATTFLAITDYDGAMSMMKDAKKASSSRNRGDTKDDEARDARLIGLNHYPTHSEERILKGIHIEPENYVGRQGRLIGLKRLPTGMEERVLTKLEAPANVFPGQDSSEEDFSDRQPSAASRLFNILFSLPVLPRDDSGASEESSVFPSDVNI